MTTFFVQSTLRAESMALHVSNHTWSLGIKFLVYLIVATLVVLIADFIAIWLLGARRKMVVLIADFIDIMGNNACLGIIFGGGIIAAMVGALFMTQIIVLPGLGDINVAGVPIIRAVIGTIILVAIWNLLLIFLIVRAILRYYHPR